MQIKTEKMKALTYFFKRRGVHNSKLIIDAIKDGLLALGYSFQSTKEMYLFLKKHFEFGAISKDSKIFLFRSKNSISETFTIQFNSTANYTLSKGLEHGL